VREISLTQGKSAIVDDEDFEWLMQRGKWYAYKSGGTFYAMRTERSSGKKVTIKMHRLIMGAEKGQFVDHCDGNGLNNSRDNLRLCSRSENACNQRIRRDNSTGFKGVHFYKGGRKFQARIAVNGRQTHIGLFSDPIEAAKTYDAAALLFHGKLRA
jgi:HNH endonuclease